MIPVLRSYEVALPIKVNTSKKKCKAINLNIYRNLHFFELNYQKKEFLNLIKKHLKHIPLLQTIHLQYYIYAQTKRKFDIMNIGSIVDKYLSDCLVELGIISDDNYEIINHVAFDFGGFTKESYVKVIITETSSNRSKDNMRILLDENEIQTALENYIENYGISGATGVVLSVENDEVIAEVIVDSEETDSTNKSASSNPKPKQKRKRRTKAEIEADEAKEKEDSNNVADPSESSSTGNNSGDSASTEDSTNTESPKEKVSNSKNLFEDQPEGSSDQSNQEKEKDDAAPPLVKKSSIFDT